MPAASAHSRGRRRGHLGLAVWPDDRVRMRKPQWILPQISQMGADNADGGEVTRAGSLDTEAFHLLFSEIRICEYLRHLRLTLQPSKNYRRWRRWTQIMQS